MRQRVMKTVIGLLMAAGILLGLSLMRGGLEHGVYSDGRDDVVIGDEVGEIEFRDTRYIVIREERALELLAGIALVAGSVAGGGWLQKRLFPPARPA